MHHCPKISKASWSSTRSKRSAVIISAWATELGITKTPTLVVLHDDKGDGDDLTKPIEMIVGCKAIKAALPATISDYTYVKTEIDEIHPRS